MGATPEARKRHTAEERRGQVLAAATTEFANRGYHGASTEEIARRAGISQPYLFRLYRTKRELFKAVVAAGFARVRATFRAAAATAGPDHPDVFSVMSGAYSDLLSDRELLLLQLQAYAATSDEDIRAAVQHEFDELTREVSELSGAPGDDVSKFVAQGLVLNVTAALGKPGYPWLWRPHES